METESLTRIICVAFALFAMYFVGWISGAAQMQREAVKANVAYWESGSVTFHWITE